MLVIKRTDLISITIPSLPPEEVDLVDRMYTYFDWLGSKSPSQAAMLLDMKNSLLEARHNFNMIFRISDIRKIISCLSGPSYARIAPYKVKTSNRLSGAFRVPFGC